ncbi:MAG: GAF domain-containing protein [Chloroflexota bacterium]|jgi:signal transduction histidine kinase
MANNVVSDVLGRSGKRTRWAIALLFAGLILLQAVVFAIVIGLIWGESLGQWLPELLIGSMFLLTGGLAALVLLSRQQREMSAVVGRADGQEQESLAMFRNQANALKALAAAIGSARDLNGLFAVILDSYQLALNDSGVPTETQSNAIYLLEADQLSLAAARGPAVPEEGAGLARGQGIISRALAQAELMVSTQPQQDPTLTDIDWLQDRQQVICVPLCTAHGLYGLAMLAMANIVPLSADETGLLEAIADQAALALHDFQVNQRFAQNSMAALTAEESERRLLRQALHEGPSRSVATVAMRLGLLRAMMIKNPDQAALELARVEAQTRRSSEQLKHLVSDLRPLHLEVKNLDRAIDTALLKIEGEIGLAVRSGRRAADERLNAQARAVILYVLEGSLAWARQIGQASTAEINLWQEDRHLYVSIEHDGAGRMNGKGQGLIGDDELAMALMRLKGERVGGQLDVTAKDGRGGVILLSVPLEQPGRTAQAYGRLDSWRTV